MNAYTEPSTSSMRQAVPLRCSRLLEPRAGSCWHRPNRAIYFRSSGCKAMRLHRRSLRCRAEERNSTEEKPAASGSQDDKIKQTLAGLDALLGLEAQEKIDKTQNEKQVT